MQESFLELIKKRALDLNTINLAASREKSGAMWLPLRAS
jgi:hypothetical protein